MASQDENSIKEEDQAAGDNADAKLPVSEQRRSERKRKSREPLFSPDDFMAKTKTAASPAASFSITKKRRTVRHRCPAASAADRPFDILPNGQPFSCDLCQSPYVCNPLLSKGGSRGKRSRHMPSPRQKLNTATGKLLTLCNACCQSLEGPRPAKRVIQVSQEEKEAYITEAKAFASDLADRLQDPEAQRFYCPHFSKNPCRCLQKYISADGSTEQGLERARDLLALYKQAKKLAAEKVYNLEELVKKYSSKRRAKYNSIGLGNGHKRSQRFEAFILEHRIRLKHDLHLCERATQRILCYSNNFLHKKLKTEERGSRVVRQKGKAALGLLDPLEDIGRRHCCVDQCVRMVHTHRNLLSQWRKRAVSSQREARCVLAEMLTPSGGVRCNCYKFIGWVTGCSHSTISKVRDQMRRTKGDREPPQHGLYSYWERKTHTRKHRRRPSATVTQDGENRDIASGSATYTELSAIDSTSSFISVTGGASSVPTGVDEEMDAQRQQLLQLRDQVQQQQASISQQQQMVQQQIAALSSMQQLNWSHTASNAASIQQQVLQQMTQLHTAQQHLAATIHSLQKQLSSLQPAQHLPAVLNSSMPAVLPSTLSTGAPVPPNNALPAPINAAVPTSLSAGVPVPASATLMAPVNTAMPTPLHSTLPGQLSVQQPVHPPPIQLPVPYNNQQVPAPMPAPIIAPFNASAPVNAQLPASFSAQIPAVQTQQHNPQHLPLQHPSGSLNTPLSSVGAQQSMVAQQDSSTYGAQVVSSQLPGAVGDQPQQAGASSFRMSSQQQYAAQDMSFHHQGSQQSQQIGVVAFTQQQQQTCISTGTYDFGQQIAVQQPPYSAQHQQKQQQQLQLPQAPQQRQAQQQVLQQEINQRSFVQPVWTDTSCQPPPYFSTLQSDGAQCHSVVHIQNNHNLQQKNVQQQNVVTQQWTLQQQQQQTLTVGQPLQQNQHPVMVTLIQPGLQQSQQQPVRLNQFHQPQQQHFGQLSVTQEQLPSLPSHQMQQAVLPQQTSHLPTQQSLQQAEIHNLPTDPDPKPQQEHQQLFRPPPYRTVRGSLRQPSSSLPLSSHVIHSVQNTDTTELCSRAPPTSVSEEPVVLTSTVTVHSGTQSSAPVVQTVTPLSSYQAPSDPKPGPGHSVVEPVLLSQISSVGVSQSGPVQVITLGVPSAQGLSLAGLKPGNIQIVQPPVDVSQNQTMVEAGPVGAGQKQGQVLLVCNKASSEVTQTQHMSHTPRVTPETLHVTAQSSGNISAAQQCPALPSAVSDQISVHPNSKGMTVTNMTASSSHMHTVSTQSALPSDTSTGAPSLILTLPRQLALPSTRQPLILTTACVNSSAMLLQQPVNLSQLLVCPQVVSGSVGPGGETCGGSEESSGTGRVVGAASSGKRVAVQKRTQHVPVVKKPLSELSPRASSSALPVHVSAAVPLAAVGAKPVKPVTVCQTVASSSIAQTVVSSVMPRNILAAAIRQANDPSIMLQADIIPNTPVSSVISHSVGSVVVSENVTAVMPQRDTPSLMPQTVISSVLPVAAVSSGTSQKASSVSLTNAPGTVSPNILPSSSITQNTRPSALMPKTVPHAVVPQPASSTVRPQTVVLSVLPKTVSSVTRQPPASPLVGPTTASYPTIPKKRKKPAAVKEKRGKKCNAGEAVITTAENVISSDSSDVQLFPAKQLLDVTITPSTALTSSVQTTDSHTVSTSSSDRPLLSLSTIPPFTSFTLPDTVLLKDGQSILLTNSSEQRSQPSQTVVLNTVSGAGSVGTSVASGSSANLPTIPIMLISSDDPFGQSTSSAVVSTIPRKPSEAGSGLMITSMAAPSLRSAPTMVFSTSNLNEENILAHTQVKLKENEGKDVNSDQHPNRLMEVEISPEPVVDGNFPLSEKAANSDNIVAKKGKKTKKTRTTKKQKQAENVDTAREQKSAFPERGIPVLDRGASQTLASLHQPCGHPRDVTPQEDLSVRNSHITKTSNTVPHSQIPFQHNNNANVAVLGSQGGHMADIQAPGSGYASLSTVVSASPITTPGRAEAFVTSKRQVRTVEKLIAGSRKSGQPVETISVFQAPAGKAVSSECKEMPAASSAPVTPFSGPSFFINQHSVIPQADTSYPSPPVAHSAYPHLLVTSSASTVSHSPSTSLPVAQVPAQYLTSSSSCIATQSPTTPFAAAQAASPGLNSPCRPPQTLPAGRVSLSASKIQTIPRSSVTQVTTLPMHCEDISAVGTRVRILPQEDKLCSLATATSVDQVCSVVQNDNSTSSVTWTSSLKDTLGITGTTSALQPFQQNLVKTVCSSAMLTSADTTPGLLSSSVKPSDAKLPVFKTPVTHSVRQAPIPSHAGSAAATHTKPISLNAAPVLPQIPSADVPVIITSVPIQSPHIPSTSFAPHGSVATLHTAEQVPGTCLTGSSHQGSPFFTCPQKRSAQPQQTALLPNPVSSTCSAFNATPVQPLRQQVITKSCQVVATSIPDKVTSVESVTKQAEPQTSQVPAQTTSSWSSVKIAPLKNVQGSVTPENQQVTLIASQSISDKVVPCQSKPAQSMPFSTQTSPAGFPVRVTPVGEGKKQKMRIASPMSLQQLKALLSHIQLPVGSVVRQISSSIKSKGSPMGVGLAEITVPAPSLPSEAESTGKMVAGSGHDTSVVSLPSAATPLNSESLTSTSGTSATRTTTKRNRAVSLSQKLVTKASEVQPAGSSESVPNVTVTVNSPRDTDHVDVSSNIGSSLPAKTKLSAGKRSKRSNSSSPVVRQTGNPSFIKGSVGAKVAEHDQLSFPTTAHTDQTPVSDLPAEVCQSAVTKHPPTSLDSVLPPNDQNQSNTATKATTQTAIRRSASNKTGHGSHSVSGSSQSVPVLTSPHSSAQQVLRGSDPVPTLQTFAAQPCITTTSTSRSVINRTCVNLTDTVSHADQSTPTTITMPASSSYTSSLRICPDQSQDSVQNTASAPSHQTYQPLSSELKQLASTQSKQPSESAKSKQPKNKDSVLSRVLTHDRSRSSQRDDVSVSAKYSTLSADSDVVQRTYVEEGDLSYYSKSVLHSASDSAELTPAFCSTTSEPSDREKLAPSSSPSSMVTLHTMSNVPYHFTCDTATSSALLPVPPANNSSNMTMVINPHHTDSHPAYSTAALDRLHTASPAILLPQMELDEMNRDVEFLSNSAFFPFLSTTSRSRNSSGASSIEPSITLDPTILPIDFMQIVAQQGLTFAVTEVVPPTSTDDPT